MEEEEAKKQRDVNFISLGCDCHPSIILKHLEIRTVSLPFDWLASSATHALEYIVDNVETKFQYFTSDLQLKVINNNRKFPVASRYPKCFFMHHPDLMTSKAMQETFMRRGQRFLDCIDQSQSSPCNFLFCTKANAFFVDDDFGKIDLESVDILRQSIQQFAEKVLRVGVGDILGIYIRYDEFTELKKAEASGQDQALIDLLLPIAGEKKHGKKKSVVIHSYVMERKQFGYQGNPKQYQKLMDKLFV